MARVSNIEALGADAAKPRMIFQIKIKESEPMKLFRIWLIILLLVAMGSLITGKSSGKQKGPIKNAPGLTEPQKVVGDYFAAYIAWLQYDFKEGGETAKLKEAIPNLTIDPYYVTQHYIDSYKKLMQENEKTTPPGEVGFLNYDPIICAQDYPDNMAQASVVLVKHTGTDASVKVNLSGKITEKPLIVKLKKQPEGWRIDDIVCDKNDFDSLYKGMVKWYKQQKK
jgi:hypothetical protein